ncbi:MAG: hypothetical protein VXX02_04195 [Pseudomonadota bacterium]|nr:hypothetical protein [Pseudomonadota bacterium]MEC7453077.1 hypothetical protein [Pseudomonadota bacterium]
MAERLPRYRPLGARIAQVPRVDYVATARAQASASTAIANALDRVNDFAFEYAKLEAVEYGVANAPTAQQIEDAQKTGEELELPRGTIARAAALDVVYNTMQTAARQEITLMRQDPANRMISAEEFADKVDAVIKGYAATLEAVRPSVGAKFTAAMSAEGNTALRAHLAEAIKLQTEQNRASQLSTANSILEGIPEVLQAGASVGADGTVRTVFDQFATLREQIGGLHELTGVEISGFEIKFDEAVEKAITVSIADWMAQNSTHTKQFVTGNIEDPNIALIVGQLDAVERQAVLINATTMAAENEEALLKIDQAREAKRVARAEEASRLGLTAFLNGDDEDFTRQSELLKSIDPEKYQSLLDATIYNPGKSNPDVVFDLKVLALDGQLTLKIITDNAEDLSLADLRSFVDHINSQRDSDYQTAISMARERYAVPDGIVLNPASEKTKKLTRFQSQLLQAIKRDPRLDRVEWARDYLKQDMRSLADVLSDITKQADALKRSDDKFTGPANIEGLRQYYGDGHGTTAIRDIISNLLQEHEDIKNK